MDISEFKTNKTLEREGVWVEISEDAKLLVARANNPKATELMEAKVKPMRRQFKLGVVSAKMLRKITAEVMAKTILLGWEGLLDGGKPLVYSEDKAHELLVKFDDFYGLVDSISMDRANYQDEEIEEEAKN